MGRIASLASKVTVNVASSRCTAAASNALLAEIGGTVVFKPAARLGMKWLFTERISKSRPILILIRPL